MVVRDKVRRYQSVVSHDTQCLQAKAEGMSLMERTGASVTRGQREAVVLDGTFEVSRLQREVTLICFHTVLPQSCAVTSMTQLQSR